MAETEFDRGKAQKEIMAAARHLSAARMAWSVNRTTPGIDWRGCTKGHMARGLVTERYGRRPVIASAKDLGRLVLALRSQENPRGLMALREQERPAVEARVTVLSARIEELAPALARHKSGVSVRLGVENESNRAKRECEKLLAGLAKIV